LFVFDSAREFEEYGHTDALVRETFGIAATPYNATQLTKLEPALKSGLGGGWHYEGDCHLRPDRLMNELRTRLERCGVDILEHQEMTGFVREAGRARAVRTSGSEFEGDQFVVATGAWTPLLNEHLGCRIPIQPGKGYSLTMPRPELCPRIPMILESHRVGITPMQSAYRIGSTMEFAGYDTSINRRRLGLLRAAAEHYLREPYREPIEEEWYGWRPMTWDGLPVIDRSPQIENVWIAAGHNMLGLSMAPATGRLVAEMINGEEPHLDPAPYAVARLT
jgi:D-amino-acid dehydrogenase